MIRCLLAAAVLIACCVLLPVVGMAAAPARCDLALILASDVSSSMTQDERTLVRQGTAAALRSPEVAEAARDSDIRILAVDWSVGQAVTVDWARVTTQADLLAFADRLEAAPSIAGTNTDMAAVMAFAARAFEDMPCDRQVLDIMTDGESTTPTLNTRDTLFDPTWQVINVIAVSGRPHVLETMDRTVRTGFGSFVMPVATFAEYAFAIRRKIKIEVSQALTGRSAI